MTTENQPEKKGEEQKASYRSSSPSKKIQIPYINTFHNIGEYKKSYLAKKIDFYAAIGPDCPICGRVGCYNKRKSYWRYAIEIDPFKKEKVPIARFECRNTRRTFSLLPIQLIPYHQYTINSIVGMILLVLQIRDQGQQGFYGASQQADADSDITAFLILCWMRVVLIGLRRGHHVLGRYYDLGGVNSTTRAESQAEELAFYFLVLSKGGIKGLPGDIPTIVRFYSRSTGQFLFGTPSQQRIGKAI